MAVEGFVGPGNQSGIGEQPRYMVVDIRVVGPNVFEARDSDGLFSATGYTPDDALAKLRTRLPAHYRVWRVWYPDARESVEVESIP